MSCLRVNCWHGNTCYPSNAQSGSGLLGRLEDKCAVVQLQRYMCSKVASQVPTRLLLNRFIGSGRCTVNILDLWGVDIGQLHSFDETWVSLCHSGTKNESW